MPIRRLASVGVFEPDEISRLQGVFDQLCARGHIDRKSVFAEEIAMSLIAEYQGGLRGEELARVVARKKGLP